MAKSCCSLDCLFYSSAAAVLSRLERHQTLLFQSAVSRFLRWRASSSEIGRRFYAFVPLPKRDSRSEWVSHYFGPYAALSPAYIYIYSVIHWFTVVAAMFPPPARCSTWDMCTRKARRRIIWLCENEMQYIVLSSTKRGASGGHLWGLRSSSGFLLWQPAPAVPMPVSI